MIYKRDYGLLKLLNNSFAISHILRTQRLYTTVDLYLSFLVPSFLDMGKREKNKVNPVLTTAV